MLERHFATASHDMYQDDAVVELPQSGERFEGVENLQPWRSDYPAETKVEFREIRGGGDLWIVEILISYDGGPWNHGVGILELRDEKIARETIYFGEPFEPQEFRAQWRAAP